MAKKPLTDELLGARVRARRQDSEIGFKELAEAIGVSEQMLQKYETGVSPMKVTTLVAIASALKCKTTDLIP